MCLPSNFTEGAMSPIINRLVTNDAEAAEPHCLSTLSQALNVNTQAESEAKTLHTLAVITSDFIAVISDTQKKTGAMQTAWRVCKL